MMAEDTGAGMVLEVSPWCLMIPRSRGLRGGVESATLVYLSRAEIIEHAEVVEQKL